jgi:3-hydroxyisobutyrate dehydrogenase-like beta-hydroxyacid dehydrogenase
MHEDNETIGLIGVGLLGSAIAERLIRGGAHVCGHDRRSAPLDALVAQGGRKCGTAADLLARCRVIVMSLPDSSVSAQVVSENGTSLQRGQTLIDTTTGDPEEMVAIGQSLRDKGIAYLEATVAGSSAQVRSGEACLLVGGDDHAVRANEQVLGAIAPRHFHLGPVGTASRFKLVHNLVLGLNRAVLAEGLSFAQVLGFDPGRVLEILKETPAASKVMESKGRKMVSGDWAPQARLSQHLKDVRLIVAAAQQRGLPIPLSRVHQQLLERAERLGFGDADNSAVIEAYRQGSEDAV